MRTTRKRPAVRLAAAFGVSKSRVRPTDAERIRRVFTTLLRESGARCAILLETTGALLAKLGDAGTLQLHTAASLLAGQLAIAQQVAGHFSGEFTLILHQGKRGSVQLTMAGRKRLLAVIFGNDAVLSNVVKGARHAAMLLDAVLPRSTLKLPSPPAPLRLERPRSGLGSDFVEAAKARIEDLLR